MRHGLARARRGRRARSAGGAAGGRQADVVRRLAAGASLSDKWQRYYAAAGDAPRETLLQALAAFEAEGQPPGLAVDLGCGAGRDTLELLRRGWRVVAVDAEPEAFELLLANPDAATRRAAIETVTARFADADWPEAELVNASVSLPFARPSEFERTWARIVASLRSGGRFCGQLFGEHDGWAPADDMTFQSRAQVEELLAGLDVERLDEIEQEGQTAVGDPKHWHLFHVVARKP